MSFKTFGANDYNETFRNASIFSQKNRCRAMLQRLAGWIFMISKCPLCPNVHDVACGYTFHIQRGAKKFPLVWNSRLISAKQNGQPMYSQLALTEHASLNLAPLILLDPVISLQKKFPGAGKTEERHFDMGTEKREESWLFLSGRMLKKLSGTV